MTNKLAPSCEKVQEQLSSFLDNALAGRESIDVATHIEACPVCYQDFRRIQAVRDAVRRLPAPASADAVRARAFQRLENVVLAKQGQEASTPRRISLPRISLNGIAGWGSALATVTAAAIAAGIVFLVPMPTRNTGIVSPVPSPISTAGVPSETEMHDFFTLHDVRAVEWTGDDTLTRRDAAAQAHGTILGNADAAVTGSL